MTELQFVTNSITQAQHRTGPDGRAYLVAPGTIIVEGVLGNELLLASEFGRHPQGWAGRPLPLLHPQADGHYVSANSPDLVERVSVGYFYNPTVTGNKLQGEYWVDVEKARRLGGEAQELLARLEANQKIETSTAYFRDFDPTPGTWNGKQYAGIARNIVPDHVAVLVNEIGNCSIADGCGLLANSCGCGGVETVTVDNVQDSQPVVVETEAEQVTNQEGVAMSEKTEVTANTEAAAEKVEKTAAPVVVQDDSAVVAVNAKVAELSTELDGYRKFFSDLGGFETVRETLQLAKANAQAMAANARREKDGLIASLTTNARCEFSKEDLEKMDIEQLGKLSRSLMQVDYSGRGIAANRRQPAVDELVELAMPDILQKEAA